MASPRTQFGFSLLEVLVALVVLSVGLLAHVKIQALGVRASTEANLRSQATFLVNDMVERLRANRPAAQSGYYAGINYGAINCTTPPAKICSEGSTDVPPDAVAANGCTENEMADEDAVRWYCGVAATLPNGNVAVSATAGPTATQIYSIQVSWDGLDEDGTVQNLSVAASVIP
jgi:type IV pilus assembly protein PilV